MLDTSTPMSPETQNELGRIFADPAAYADPKAWYESARRLREQAPIARVTLPAYQDFWAITKYSDIREIERNSDIFTNAPAPTLVTRKEYETREQAQQAAVNTLIQMDGDVHK